MSSKGERTRQRVIESAADLLRGEGLGGISIGEVMKKAGLTTGGFYFHFRDTDELCACGFEAAFRESMARLEQGLAHEDGPEWLKGIIARYLSDAHAKDVTGGCPIPAILSEVTRSKAVAKVFEQELGSFARRLAGAVDRRRAFALAALMVGGIALARAVRRPKLRTEILRGCREAALALATA